MLEYRVRGLLRFIEALTNVVRACVIRLLHIYCDFIH